MSVELDPQELGFMRPFTSEVSQVLRLHNPNNDPVAFKVKTTAPKQYCVRPNSGRIDAGQQVEVQVLLQAMKEDPPPDTKCRDKFLVQSVPISPENADGNVTQIWSNMEQNAKSSIQEKKIRVNFLPADGSSGSATNDAALPVTAAAGGAAAAGAAGTAAAVTNGVTSHNDDDQPPSYSSPSPPATTPQRTSGTSDAGDTTTATAGETSTLGASIPTTQEDLKAQLEEAKATIARLQAQASESLRQRKPQEAAEKAMNSVQQSMQNAPAPGGVPLQVVAALCLICFLIAWIFF